MQVRSNCQYVHALDRSFRHVHLFAKKKSSSASREGQLKPKNITMACITTSVLLFKDVDDCYTRALCSRGLSAVYVPVLETISVDDWKDPSLSATATTSSPTKPDAKVSRATTAATAEEAATSQTPLHHPEMYGGLIFTSARAVAAVKEWLENDASYTADASSKKCLLAKWAAGKVYTVGPKTAAAAASLFSSFDGEQDTTYATSSSSSSQAAVSSRDYACLSSTTTGTASALADLIVTEFKCRWERRLQTLQVEKNVVLDRLSSDGTSRSALDTPSPPLLPLPLLFVCGKRRRDTLPAALTIAGVPFRELIVYETQPRATALSEAVARASACHVAVFFSPLGAEAIIPAIIANNTLLPTLGAIGPTTAQAVAKLAGIDLQQVITAAKPTPEALAEALYASL